ncbi:MAG: acetylornithine/N-succinyldiaminopimelate aminotransferase [Nitrospirae bacterium]|nr:MAG: acetylornithine/N-succinyldiaminopimelate aminotransferase [Nitrospirota bacterium]
METKKLLEEADKYVMHTYGRFPVALRKGRGMRVWSTSGKEYLDFLGGIAVNVLGHCHPKVVVTIQKQAQRLIHVSNLYHIEPQVRLAKLLCTHSFADKVFFCNSGAEANEAAIKLVRKYASEQLGAGRSGIISTLNSFHGRTLGALTATGQEKFHKGFGPLVPGFTYVPFDDLDSMKAAVSPETCAIILEPVQAEGGVQVPSPEYLKGVRKICDDNGILLILDEVQTGMGRTGTLFAHEQFGIVPDVMTLAKGLGAGVPIGAMLATDKVAASFQPKTHASTFGGNPLVCAAAITTLEVILEDGFVLDHVNRISRYFMGRLEQLKNVFSDKVVAVRGMGLLIGVELVRDALPVVNACMERGILVGTAGSGNVLRLTPPLIVEEKDIDVLITTLEDVLEK